MTQAVIFDLFGTLVDNFRQDEYEQVQAEMAATLGAPRDGYITLWADTFVERMTGAFPSVEDNILRVCKELGVRVEAKAVAKTSQL